MSSRNNYEKIVSVYFQNVYYLFVHAANVLCKTNQIHNSPLRIREWVLRAWRMSKDFV
jgi:hypothetical protein